MACSWIDWWKWVDRMTYTWIGDFWLPLLLVSTPSLCRWLDSSIFSYSALVIFSKMPASNKCIKLEIGAAPEKQWKLMSAICFVVAMNLQFCTQIAHTHHSDCPNRGIQVGRQLPNNGCTISRWFGILVCLQLNSERWIWWKKMNIPKNK